MPTALALFERIGASAPGRWLFTRLVCWRAPYFATPLGKQYLAELLPAFAAHLEAKRQAGT